MKFVLKITMALSLLGLLACSGSRQETSQSSHIEQVIPLDTTLAKGKLANGLTYYIRENAQPENRGELRLVVNAGSILEDDDQLGLAHFVEHMAFNGTENFHKQELVRYLESIGMRFGPDLNAYTSFDETVYILQIPTDSSHIVEKAFSILADWAQRVEFEGEEIDKERGVVLEEWRSRRGAQARLLDKQLPVLLKDSRYAQRLPIGAPEILQNFEHETLRRFYHDWYRPDLMAVVAVGDFDKELIEKLIRENFSPLPTADSPRERVIYPIPGHQQTYVSIETDPEATSNSISVIYKQEAQKQGTEQAYRRSIVEDIYHTMFNDRLDEIRQQPDAPFLYAYSGQGMAFRAKEFLTLGTAVSNNGMLDGLEAVLTEAKRIKTHGFTASELERAKTNLMRSMERIYEERDKSESRSFAAEYIRNFLTNEPIPGIEWEYNFTLTHTPGISLAEVNQLANQLISSENRVILATLPDKEDVAVPTEAEILAAFTTVQSKTVEAYVDKVSDAPLLAQAPVAGQVVQEVYYDTVKVSEWTLSNGVKVVVKPTDFKNDQIVFRSFSPGGHSLVEDQDFIAAITSTSLIEESGLANFDLIELQKKLAGKAVSVSPWIGELQEGINGSASPQDLETMLQLLYLYFTEPRADSSAYLSFRQQIEASLANRAASPGAAFNDTLQLVLSQNHFRARPFGEHVLAEMDLKRSLDIYRTRFADASDFTFVFVGNIDLAAFKPLIETYIGALPSLNRQETWRDIGMRPPQGIVRKEVYKGLEQKSNVRLIFSGPIEWTRQNRYDLSALAAVLRIKLREALREEKGGTYGVGVSAGAEENPVPSYSFSISFGCNPDRVDELLGDVVTQLDSLKQYPVAARYIETVQESQRRQRESSLKRNGFWLSALENYYEEGRDPRDILLKGGQLTEKLSPDAVQAAAQQYINMKNYVQVVLYPER